ncbi:glycoside hydrolase family 15 protein [Aggregicoccus sp. 17bor-14]|uniref:glycoside hydrolase family 15 protein n=1 Tax=Myxococcaceae TaxID=31 RepID=UPI00129C150F|nr:MULTISPECIES: glycoside hydrolase family 15 protein [Myxococcaceae]MBF5042176.1 glycoside hydrolase family 15 protein [Simulacricoccus sp. 17bor-14]MRI87953.1 glycoside hydrolase family 15 protein [Aggregicoccus sp. 17bor-14]
MAPRIEDYALLGDTQTAALVSREGSIDWLCLPRFDSAACFAALLGEPGHGRWLLAPVGEVRSTRRRYRPGTLVLETEHETPTGRVRVVDCMPPRGHDPDVVRLVEGVSGEVTLRMELIIRFDYGSVVPWVRREDGALQAVAGPDALLLRTPVPTHGEGLTTVAEFRVREGERVPFVLTWHPSHTPLPPALDAVREVGETQHWWERWAHQCTYRGPWKDEVLSSLVALKALTYAPTGGIVAAATTSLPEWLGGVRNWDYRYCWLRDATFTLTALILNGYRKEAAAWRDWLLRSVAGDPSQLRIMYGLAGERRLPEYTVDWLPGFAGSRPVRVGNAAATQLQLDVYGEVMDALHQARRTTLDSDANSWRMQVALMEYLEGAWQQPDEGLWEVRGPRQHFTHSKMMTWVAFDRAVKAVEKSGLEGPVERWRALRDEVHREVCAKGFHSGKGAFAQAYGSDRLDASLLLMPLVGFLPATDPRVASTVAAIERELLEDGFVMRYSPAKDSETSGHAVDGLPGREGAFLACSFWLADNYALMGRTAEAEALFRRLLSLRNDVGLLSEEYDARGKRQLGNFPQAFSHVGLINTALNLTPQAEPGPAQQRRNGC